MVHICMHSMYSSGQNKVPTAEWRSRLIVAQSENRLSLCATLVAGFFFQVLMYVHIMIFCHTHYCLLPPGIVVLSAQQSASYSWTIHVDTMLPGILR